MEDNLYTYDLGVPPLPTTYDQLRTCGVSCCATYVYWVVKDAGFDLPDTPIHGADTLSKSLKNIGFREIDISEMQAGDIQWFPGEHIQICGGDGLFYNAGSTEAIQTSAPSARGSDPSGATILRAP